MDPHSDAGKRTDIDSVPICSQDAVSFDHSHDIISVETPAVSVNMDHFSQAHTQRDPEMDNKESEVP
eukprot:CAMPEP_0201577712 /NCGR_PEP_ID=MMETSP0190_2-20130828/24198_1 /ASSEMBLY_ACC=CAM_ASM_000263 /TAXON_ID=37353 /ORGANISM="Rosalina sp." /LENGTH=66 /DNA_ID=CAMNT_0048010025 /DNA_START=219 /DNA_END=419 /DNA_ORIENTATION=-